MCLPVMMDMSFLQGSIIPDCTELMAYCLQKEAIRSIGRRPPGAAPILSCAEKIIYPG